jgi:hypothetical protein
MRSSRWRCAGSLLAPLLFAGCGEPTQPPDHGGGLPDPPDLVAVVYQTTHRTGTSPAGPLDQYELWVGPRGSSAPDAGLIVGPAAPVFRRVGGELRATTGAAIAVGDHIEAWRDTLGGAAFGSVQAPPGAPAYFALQVVIAQP